MESLRRDSCVGRRLRESSTLKILDTGLIFSRCMAKGCEPSFNSFPPISLSAPNNKSLNTILELAKAELERQVNIRILSEVPYRPFTIKLISVVFTNKWRLMVNCRLLKSVFSEK